MTKIIKNTTISDITLSTVGLTIPASDQITLVANEHTRWAESDVITEVTPLINAGDLVINDGNIDLIAVEGINYLKYPDNSKNARFDVPAATEGDFGTLIPAGDNTVEDGIINAGKVVRVSSTDTRTRHLEDKLEAGSAITLSKIVDGVTNEETIRISAQDAIDNDLDTLGFGRTGTVTDTFLRSVDNLPSDASPEVIAYDMVLRRISFSNNKVSIGNIRVEVYEIDITTPARTQTLLHTEDFIGITSGATYTIGAELNVQIDEGTGLAVKMISLTNPKPADVKCLLWLRKGLAV